jgi:multiple sugar transport system permease protein
MRRSLAYRWTLTAVGAVIAALYLFPVYWMYISSFKSPSELFVSPPTLWPSEIHLGAYAWIFTRENIPAYLANSFLIAGAVTLLSMLFAILSAYALARLRSRLVDVALIAVMLSQVLPPALMATPIFIMFRQLDLLNSYQGVVLAITTKTLPFAVVILRTTFLQVPGELEEAARVDGCTRFSALWRIVLPTARTGILVTALLVFLISYGDFVYPLALMNSPRMQPATVGLSSFIGAEFSDWNNIMAFASIFVTPVLLGFLLAQRKIVSGLTAGALK